MYINEECVRSILIYLQEKLDIQQHDNKCCFLAISVQDLTEKFENQYNGKDIWYSVYNLSECGFIEGINVAYMKNCSLDRLDISNITYRGHRFIESIRPETVWDKTKGIISKVGVHTLDFIECVAHDVAVESAKQAVTVAMK